MAGLTATDWALLITGGLRASVYFAAAIWAFHSKRAVALSGFVILGLVAISTTMRTAHLWADDATVVMVGQYLATPGAALVVLAYATSPVHLVSGDRWRL